jgi:hypothetical protein
VVDAEIYASVVLGLLLLYAAEPLVPSWLLTSLAIGEFAYAGCAVCVARGSRGAYYVAFALAVLVLVVSLPRPEHYAFAAEGDVGAFLIFAAGSVLQASLLVEVPIFLRRTRRR